MDYKIGDIVQTKLYEGAILYRVVCFFDRGSEQACAKHPWVDPKLGADDTHLVVIWKSHEAIAPAWPIGANPTFNCSDLRAPSNEMLALALASV